MSPSVQETEIWADARGIPQAVADTLTTADGFDDVVTALRDAGVRRIVASGNGASYYVALALWLASLEDAGAPCEVVAVPGGLIAKGRFQWRPGDVLMAISASGEFRDVIEAIEDESLPRPFVAITATAESTIGRAADARAIIAVNRHIAVTHTQAFCSAVAAVLSIWSRLTGDEGLERALAGAEDAAGRAVEAAERWLAEHAADVPTPIASVAFGTGPAWAGAMEAALLIKEIARIPCEGIESREAATAAMTGLLPGHLVVGLPLADDPFSGETAEICRRLGATAIALPGGDLVDARLAAITTFPPALALATELAQRSGHDPDSPAWLDVYFETARTDGKPSPLSPAHGAGSQSAGSA
jgi:fructoselysine-6-P-deglycase FrlB-like protein